MAFDGIACSGVKVLDQAAGDNWCLWQADCVDAIRGLPDGSIGYSLFSPPFQSLYTFSDDLRDMSNCADDTTFWEHYSYLARLMYDKVMPGRSVSIHCMDLPTSKTRDGYVGLRDFPSENRRIFEDAGFVFHSRAVVHKDPVSAMQRTKALGLLHKQVVKDSSLSRMGIADMVITLRKPNDNPEPIAGRFDVYHGALVSEVEEDIRRSWEPNGGRSFDDHRSISIWQRYAEPIWLDIVQGDTLSRVDARAEEDERHISPLQLDLVRRCLQMWTNPVDVVFSPFSGIGSVGYVALSMRRRFAGIELKRSYFEQAVANLRRAEVEAAQPKLFEED